jgi:hypothetical protein
MRSFGPRPQGRLKTLAGLATASERRALALLPTCPPPAPTPSSHRRSVRTLLRQKTFRKRRPRPFVGRVSASISSRKRHIGHADREIIVLVYGYYVFPKPSVQGFPTAADPADRSYRYLV